MFLLTAREDDPRFSAYPQSPPMSANINNHLRGENNNSPPRSISPKKLELSPVGKGSDRPTVQKFRNGKYRDSVIVVSETTQSLLSSFNSLEGYLKKKSSNFSGFQRRYFLVDGAYIKYFSNENHTGEVPLAAIDIRQMSNIQISADSRCIFCFDLADGSRRYQLRADTPSIAMAWVENLQDRRRALLEAARQRCVRTNHGL